MIATPEMIAAAWASWHSRHGGRIGPGPGFVEAIESALAAAPAVLVEEKTPKVSPLKWSDPAKPDGKSSFYDHCSAESAIGIYRIEWKDWKTDTAFTIDSDLGWFGCEYSLDDAKAAAQADYERRVLSSLSEEPTP